jgi:hypothetical protein
MTQIISVYPISRVQEVRAPASFGFPDLRNSETESLTCFDLSPRVLFDNGWSSYFRDFVGLLHLARKDHAPSYGFKDGWSSGLDQIPGISSLLLRTTPI